VGAARAVVSGSRAWTLRRLDGGVIAREKAGARLLVARGGGGALEVSREGESKPVWSGSVSDTLVLDPGDGGYSGWNGNWYRGGFRLHASSPEGLTLVNEVDLEGYLRSVLPNEIGTPPESDFEAVKAQAVAARSYTLAYLGRRAELGFDLYASVEDQVYAGKTLENAQSDRALAATRGEVLVSEGQPIRALYSSACGGRTANVEDVWPWSWTPYLRSVRDAAGLDARPYCSLSASFRWREEWDAPGFLAMLRQYGPPGDAASGALRGEVLDVRIERRSRCGRIQDLAVSTTAGEITLHGDRVRWALRRPGSGAILRSSFFKIGVLRDGDGRATKVVASGAGNGHGIGLCQWGAMGMARAGSGYREILSHYYKATRIVRI
jgi:stage II sporulation protein D